MDVNVYRLALQYERKQNRETACPQVCLQCAGWKTFGGVLTPMYIAQFGPICCCDNTWLKIQNLIIEMKKKQCKKT
jgi:hypothetical protein